MAYCKSPGLNWLTVYEWGLPKHLLAGVILQVATTGGKDLPIIGELAAFFLQREIELLKEIDGNREEDNQ